MVGGLIFLMSCLKKIGLGKYITLPYFNSKRNPPPTFPQIYINKISPIGVGLTPEGVGGALGRRGGVRFEQKFPSTWPTSNYNSFILSFLFNSLN